MNLNQLTAIRRLDAMKARVRNRQDPTIVLHKKSIALNQEQNARWRAHATVMEQLAEEQLEVNKGLHKALEEILIRGTP